MNTQPEVKETLIGFEVKCPSEKAERLLLRLTLVRSDKIDTTRPTGLTDAQLEELHLLRRIRCWITVDDALELCTRARSAIVASGRLYGVD